MLLAERSRMPLPVRAVLFLTGFLLYFADFQYFTFFLPVFFALLFTRQMRFSRACYPACLFLLLLSMCFMFSLTNIVDWDVAVLSFKFILYSFVLLLFTTAITDMYGKQAMHLLLSGAAAQVIFASMYSLAAMQGLVSSVDNIIDPSRIQGFSGNPNAFGVESCVASLYLIYRIMQAKPLNKLFLLVMLGFTLSALLLCYSRAGWAMMALALLTYTTCVTVQKRSGTALLKLIGSFLVLGVCIFFALKVIQSSETGANRTRLQSYDSERFLVNEIIWNKSFDKLLGAGPGQSGVYLSNFYNNLESVGAIHNAYLRILYEGGVVGALVYLALLVYLVMIGFTISIAAWPLSNIAAAVTGLYAGLLLNAMVVDTAFDRNFWLIGGLLVGLHIQRRRWLIWRGLQ